MAENAEEILARFEDLTVLEDEFEEVELELLRQTNTLTAPLYKKRAAVAAKIPHFWALVFEQCPPEVDQHIQPSDSKVFADCLETLEVSRFETNDPKGSPRSFSVKFGFGPNEYFDNKVLEKKFWFRRANDGWMGLVSEPVKINWKKGKDLTGGLTDAAVNLWEAKKKLSGAANGNAKVKESSLPEYQALTKKIEESEESSLSFFTWFGFVSSWRYVSAEESEAATAADAEKRGKRKNGEKVDDEPEDDEDDNSQQTEVYPPGEELATIIAEDLWPSAIKYFKSAHEMDDEELSDIEVEDYDDESDEEVDIRGLVQGKGRNSKGSSDSPPPKKRKT
ncbi:hypothetical protein K432DRAFT_297305 [Lepidopterella palustris CBS 459.81]|uniref:Nap family protein n=1 Tax=Lepidopterella palustris CBS 459.81 TaxID=1314670 RepID=A0A8E2EBL7_9PEZI|nr:hypothetical protein K432DRAFT_297305 [Lepidopterella palustris CBS 459.81]